MGLRRFIGTAAQRASSRATGNAGDFAIETDTGNLAIADGHTLLGALKRLVRVDEVTAAVQQYVTSLVVTNSTLTNISDLTGYVYAIVDQNGKIALGVKPDGNIVAKFQLSNGQVTSAQLSSDINSKLLSDATLQSMLGRLPDSTLYGSTEMTLVFADQKGKMALGIDTAGHVYVPQLILSAGSVHLSNLASDVPLPATMGSLTAVYAIVDQNGRMAAWVSPDGSFDFAKLGNSAKAAIQAYFQSAGALGPATQYQPSYQNSPHKTSSGPDVVCFGDSLTAGAGGSGTTYPSTLQSLMNGSGNSGTVRNAGVGGETSVTITARTNATPLVFLPVGATQVPAGATALKVDPQAINGQIPRPLLQGNGGGVSGVLWTENGPVAGSLSLVQPGGASSTFTVGTDYYQFTRTTAGSAINFLRPAAFIYDFGQARRDDIYVCWIGQNGPSDTRARTDAQAIIQHMSALNKRFLFMGKPTNTDADDAAWHDLLGRRYIPIRKYLVTYGLQDAGITATTQDNTDIANGTVPTSLRSDSVHGNAAYYTIVGTQVYLRLKEFGWVS